MNLEKILSISGKPGLYRIISQSKKSIIVESLVDKKRFPVNALNSVSALGDIAIYTYDEEVPLKEVLRNMFTKENGGEALDPNSDKKKLLDYFREVLPEYDEERVYTSNFKKIASWYNILVATEFDFSESEQTEDDANELPSSEEKA
jgi:hypothetical protein